MKVYSIGREQGCDIVINDPTDVISRRHATLVVSPTGKMTITDLSHNGTYVNGIRIAQNVPVPVTRKDSVSFAQIARLDWNLVPQSNMVIKYAAMAAGAIIVVIACVLLFNYCGNGKGSQEPQQADTVVADTTQKAAPKTEEEIRKEIKDSMDKEAKAKADSTAEAKRKQDSIADAKKKAQAEAKEKKDKNKKDEKDKETKKNDEAKKESAGASRLR